MIANLILELCESRARCGEETREGRSEAQKLQSWKFKDEKENWDLTGSTLVWIDVNFQAIYEIQPINGFCFAMT